MYKKKKRGQSMVEFALLAPFIFLVLATIIEGSPLINAYIKVEKASETGARTAAIYGQTDNQIADSMFLDLYQMTNKSRFDAYEEPSDDNGGISTIGFYTNCSGTDESDAPDLPYTDYSQDLYIHGNQLCYSQAQEQSGYGTYLTTIMIYPTLRYRINGSWVTVSVLYNYRVHTPVLFFAADILSKSVLADGSPESPFSWYKAVPIYKYSTRKVE